MSTNAKRSRMEDGSSKSSPWKKGKTDSRNYYAKAYNDSRKRAYLQPGQRGFLVTCNMREKDCIRDSFRLLNEYADELYGKLDEGKDEKGTANKDSEEEEDISVLVEKQAESARKEKRQFRFESVDTGAKNCCFITTVLPNPKELALKIVNDLQQSKKLRSRHILRLMPIEVVTKANLKDIMDAAGGLFDNYFLKDPKTFAIVFNRRFNNALDREGVINELAGLISAKNMHNKANLKHPELAVIVEVIKGLCLISVVPQYYEFKKYNLAEICSQKSDEKEETKDAQTTAADNTTETVSEALPEETAEGKNEETHE